MSESLIPCLFYLFFYTQVYSYPLIKAIDSLHMNLLMLVELQNDTYYFPN